MAVLTGCLRIARESIFTGLNNFNIFFHYRLIFDEYFGFTDKEVKEILQYYKVPEASNKQRNGMTVTASEIQMSTAHGM